MTTTRTRTAVLGIALAGMVAVAPAADAAATTPTKVVKMTSSNMFMPMKLTITRGTTVKWSNTSFTTHNVTASSGAWASGNIDPGGTYSRTFKRAGTVRYHCTIHAGMTATIVVK